MIVQKKLPNRSAFSDFRDEFKIQLKAWKDRRNGYPDLRRRFVKFVGYDPDFENPRSFNEKIQWSKINNRNPLFPIISDKLRIRDFVDGEMGQGASEKLFPKLLAFGANPDKIPFEDMPASYVVKANHASGWNIFVTPDDPADLPRLRSNCRRWMRMSYGLLKHEWAYQAVPRRIIVEEYLDQPSGAPPNDLKFYMFNGKLGYVALDDDRFGDYVQHFADADWQPIEMVVKTELSKRQLPPRPDNYEEMLAIAHDLSKRFDAVRVDFLTTAERYYLNELTLYRDSGLKAFHPAEYDWKFGDMWTLPKL